jgi:hypothetical protein
MTHLLSIVFFVGLLIGLAMLLEKAFRDHGSAIRAALLGKWGSDDPSADTALRRIGACLRASFPGGGQEPLSDDLNRLVLQLSTAPSPRPQSALLKR